MRLRSISLMRSKAVLGILGIVGTHHAVPHHFGNNGSTADGIDTVIAMHNADLFHVGIDMLRIDENQIRHDALSLFRL